MTRKILEDTNGVLLATSATEQPIFAMATTIPATRGALVGGGGGRPPVVLQSTTASRAPVYGTTIMTSSILQPEHVTIDEVTPLVVPVTTAIPAASAVRPAGGLNHQQPAIIIHNHDDEDGHNYDESTAPQYRDVFFGVLFWVHFIFMLWLGLFVAPSGYHNMNIDLNAVEIVLKQDEDITEEQIHQFEQLWTDTMEFIKVYPLRILLYFVFPSETIAFFSAFILLAFFVKRHARAVVYLSLLSSLLFTSIITLWVAIMSGSILLYILAAVVIGAVCMYLKMAWRMAPFAAVNLKVALCGVNKNCGIYEVALLSSVMGLTWVLFWFYTVVGVFSKHNADCEQILHPDNPNHTNFDDDDCNPPLIVLLGFLLSLYWTSTIVMNTVQVTVAGVMATWCFDKSEASSCFSWAVFMSLYRSLTYSFGSICFGSLLQAIVTMLRTMLESARNQRRNQERDDCGICLCMLECLIRFFEDALDYFNQWAYVFVGIYGYSYLESGRRVMELFRARGFTAVITDNLVGYVCSFLTVFIAIINGCLAIPLEHFVTFHFLTDSAKGESYLFGSIGVGGARVCAFSLGFALGLWVCSVMMNVLKGAVNTLIVCYADSPAALEQQHPILTKEMNDAWSLVFPETMITPTTVVPVHDAIIM